MDFAFGNWLAGFVDGEGSFGIRQHRKPLANYCCLFQLEVRYDDKEIIYYIQQITGLGKVRIRIYPEGKKGIRWEVHTKPDCLELVKLFDRFPLRAKKSKDFIIWREAVLLWQTVKKGNRKDKFNWAPFEVLAQNLKETRQYVS